MFSSASESCVGLLIDTLELYIFYWRPTPSAEAQQKYICTGGFYKIFSLQMHVSNSYFKGQQPVQEINKFTSTSIKKNPLQHQEVKIPFDCIGQYILVLPNAPMLICISPHQRSQCTSLFQKLSDLFVST